MKESCVLRYAPGRGNGASMTGKVAKLALAFGRHYAESSPHTGAAMRLLGDATILSALIAAAAALWTLYWQRRKDAQTLRNALFAELRHIRQHYSYAGAELPPSQQKHELLKRLKWSRFGDLLTVKEISRYAILGTQEMQLLLQISFRVRNTDLLIDTLIADPGAVTDSDLIELGSRMQYLRRSANALIEYLQCKDSRLAAIPEPE